LTAGATCGRVFRQSEDCVLPVVLALLVLALLRC